MRAQNWCFLPVLAIVLFVSCPNDIDPIDPNGTFIIENNSKFSFTLIKIYLFIGNYNSIDDRLSPKKGELVTDLVSIEKSNTTSCVLHEGYYVIELKRAVNYFLFYEPIAFPIEKSETTTMKIHNTEFEIYRTHTIK
jgi:hypothetical protein